MNSPLYQAKGLSRVYGAQGRQVSALDNISFSIATGAFTIIVGPSGSGKSTLLNVLGFLDRPTSGTFCFQGHDARDDSPDNLARRRNQDIGFIFQAYNLLARNSASENVALPLLYAGVGASERRERAAAMLERVGLGERMDHMPAQLSGGEQQRVAIARALINEPSVLLADEPTGALDTATGEEVLGLLAALNSDGITLIVVTHSEDVADRANDRIVLRDGRIAEGSAAP